VSLPGCARPRPGAPFRMTAASLTRRDTLGLLLGAPLAAAGKDAPVFIQSTRIAKAAEYSAKRKGLALLVRQHGKLLHESYPNGAKPGETRRIYSGTKAFWGLAMLAAVEDGILSLDEPAAAVIHEWRGRGDKEKFTLEQLMDFTCGLERCLRIHEDGLENRDRMAIGRPVLAAPGKRFIYGPSAMQVAHQMLKRRLAGRWRNETPARYLERRVLRPLGLGPQRYIPDAAGNPLLASGFMMTPAQWARMGEVILAKGAPVLKKPASWELATEGSAANPAYSFGFWNNRKAADKNAREFDIEDMLEVDWDKQGWTRACVCRDAPPDLVACIGSGYQRLFAVPSMSLVIVRQGTNARFSDGDFLRLLLG